jgi:hypothetical protein
MGPKLLRIFWYSRNAPLPSQEAELRRLFGPNTSVNHYNPRREDRSTKAYDSIEDVIYQFRKVYKADEIVAVVPLTVIQELTESGIKPLYAEMQRIEVDQMIDPSRVELLVKNKRGNVTHGYNFKRFRRIVGVEIKYEDIVPVGKENV